MENPQGEWLLKHYENKATPEALEAKMLKSHCTEDLEGWPGCLPKENYKSAMVLFSTTFKILSRTSTMALLSLQLSSESQSSHFS